ncbi:MAG: ABC transporter ATP-binding protein [Rhodospirillales bacterium]|nr:ABC transporter ATP-binding protein [Rhodospirillales bacterium]
MPNGVVGSPNGVVGSPDAYLRIDRVAKRFGRATVLDALSLDVAEGEFISLLGPSGCGKTTLLRILAGLLTADAGRVTLAGRELGRLPPHKRNVGVVFQNYALFPHLTVAENIGFGLRARRVPKPEAAARVARGLEMIRLTHLADRPVTQLSGGQQQRVAMARALAVNPALILLDEPLSALDRKLRETMQVELRTLLRALRMTAIFVTHDQEEALALSDRIAVMNAGRIEQLDAPRAIYDRPASPFVLDFVGLSTTLSGVVERVDGPMLEVVTALGPVRVRGQFVRGARVLLAVRPEKIGVGSGAGNVPGAGPRAGNTATIRVADRTFLGRSCLVHGVAAEGDRVVLETSNDMGERVVPGSDLLVSWRPEDTLLFPQVAG